MCQEHFQHHYTTSPRLDCWHKAGWLYRIMLLVPNCDPVHLRRTQNSSDLLCFFQSSTVQFWEAYVYHLPLLFTTLCALTMLIQFYSYSSRQCQLSCEILKSNWFTLILLHALIMFRLHNKKNNCLYYIKYKQLNCMFDKICNT